MRRAVIYGIGEYYLNNKNKLPDDMNTFIVYGWQLTLTAD